MAGTRPVSEWRRGDILEKARSICFEVRLKKAQWRPPSRSVSTYRTASWIISALVAKDIFSLM